MKEESERRNRGGEACKGIMEKESCRRIHEGVFLEEG